ncbi:PQQ-binding-like beta-propeller repeat protein [Actinomadura sp. 9N215]|uniref:outer membrane protein assembly factor BamB family protein n=1 Tax=Actinomadura sp. 9N215 TaxID=3375150 RepID=UPI0037A05C5B
MRPTATRTSAMRWGGGLLAVLLLAVLGGVKACGGSDVADLPHGERRPKPVSFSGKPLWDERKLGMSRVAGIELRGDVAVIAGDVGLGGARLAVVDVRTGSPRWVVDKGSVLRGGGGAVAHHGSGYRAEHLRGVTGKPAVYGAGDGDDWTVLVQYTEGDQGRETVLGVAALSGKDGSVRWKQPLIRPRGGDAGDDDREQRMRLLAGDPRIVLTSVESRQGIDPKTVALDPATGRRLWENADGWAYRLVGDVVLGETRGAEAPPTHTWGEGREDTDVFAVDARTGQKRWDLGGTAESSHLMAAANGTAVVKVTETPPGRTYSRDRTMLVDAATGRPTKESPKKEDDGTSLILYGCADDDGRSLIACSGPEGRLVTIRPGHHGKPVVTEKQPFGEDTMARVMTVWRDRVLLAGSGREGRPERYAVVDRAANRAGSPPPGEATAISDGAAAFRVARAGSTSSTPDGLVVHAVSVGATPSEPAGPGTPTLRPPRIDAAPLWTAGAGEAPVPPPAKDTGLESVISMDLVGDALVYTGRDREDDDLDRLVVADAETGKVRWSVREGASLGGGAKAGFVAVPRMVDAGGERLVLVRYEASGNAEGIAALSLKDGRTRWTKPVTGGNGFVTLEAADGATIAVEVTSYDGPKGGRDETVVLATGTRRELWRKRGVSPAGVGGGLVLAARYARGENGTREPRDLIAYGASDGGQRWRLGARYREPELLHDEGGKTIVIGTADGGAVLDRATGRELARTYAPLVQCSGDGDALIVCRAGSRSGSGSDPGGRAVTVQTGGGGATIRDLLETGPLTRYGAVGTWFTAIRPAADGRPERFLLLDAAGRQIADGLPGRPVDVDLGAGFAVLTPSQITHGIAGPGVPRFTVHRVQA